MFDLTYVVLSTSVIVGSVIVLGFLLHHCNRHGLPLFESAQHEVCATL